MRIYNNVPALTAYNNYTSNVANIQNSVKKLSSGLAVVNAADNAAGLAISEKMRAQIRGLDRASQNTQEATSLIQTAEGALKSSTEILQRMRELAVQSANDTNENDIDREAIQSEFNQLMTEIDDIADKTTFNKKTLIDGSWRAEQLELGQATQLKNTGLVVELGNANVGMYNFNISVKEETAEVKAKKPDQFTVINDSYNKAFYTGVGVTGGTKVAASDLLNGNYTITAEHDNDTQSITVTATGDNGQTFSAKLSKETLDGLHGTPGDFSINFSSAADDNSFKLNLALKTAFTNSEAGRLNLTENLNDIKFAIAGGVSYKAPETAVYANLTGGESVKLETGMSSVTFSNGIKVNFDTLNVSHLDTKNYGKTATQVISAGTLLSAKDAKTSAPAAPAVQLNQNYTLMWEKSGSYTGENSATFTGTFSAYLVGEDGKEYRAATAPTISVTNGVTTNLATGIAATEFLNSDKQGIGLAFKGINETTYDKSRDSADEMLAYLNANASVRLGSGMQADATNKIVGAEFKVLDTTDQQLLRNGDKLEFAAPAAGVINVKSTSTTVADQYSGRIDSKAFMDLYNNGGGTIDVAFTDKTTGQVAFKMTYTVAANTTGTPVTTWADATEFTKFAAGAATNVTVSEVGHKYDALFSQDASSSKISVEGSKGVALTFQVGANEGDETAINIDKMDSLYLGIASSRVSTRESASKAITAVDRAINQVSAQRADLGAVQNRLKYKKDNLDTASENLTAAEGLIRNCDYAKEMTKFTNANIMQQAATAMLAQANALPQNVLSLLG